MPPFFQNPEKSASTDFILLLKPQLKNSKYEFCLYSPKNQSSQKFYYS